MITPGTALPEALFSTSKEFFKNGESLYMLFNGSVTELKELPSDYYKLLKQKIDLDKNAQKGLDILRIFSENERVYQFFECNYASFDPACDVLRHGQLGATEFVDCSKRDVCKAQGFLCTIPAGLSRRELQVARRIALGEMDAQICAELEITQSTLRNHKNNIELKIGSTGKIAIGVWAVKNKIV